MQKIILAICVLVGSFAMGQAAHANCLVIDQLDKLHGVQARLARNRNITLFSGDIRQLRAISNNISNRDTLNAVNGNSFTGQGAAFIRFLQNTQSLLQGASLDDPGSVRRHFSADVRQNLSEIGGYLPNLRCTTDQIDVAQAAQSAAAVGGNSDAEDLAEVAERMRVIKDEVFRPRTFFVVLLIVTGLLTLPPAIRRWIFMRIRRAKRHNILFHTQYRSDNHTSHGTLIDINCYGTKLRHEPDNPIPSGTQVEIEIDDDWIAGVVRWSNTHYSGVQFKRSIDLEIVEKVRTSEPVVSKSPTTQNGAPKDAV